MYYPRLIDKALAEWKLTPVRKPIYAVSQLPILLNKRYVK